MVCESGSGKSVTGMTLMGLTRGPNARISGSAKLDGQELLTASNQELRAIRGNDIAMICHRVAMAEEALAVLGQLDRSMIDRALAAVAGFKRDLVPPDPFSETRFRELDQKVWDLRVATLGPEKAAQRSPDDGKRSPVEVY